MILCQKLLGIFELLENRRNSIRICLPYLLKVNSKHDKVQIRGVKITIQSILILLSFLILYISGLFASLLFFNFFLFLTYIPNKR